MKISVERGVERAGIRRRGEGTGTKPVPETGRAALPCDTALFSRRLVPSLAPETLIPVAEAPPKTRLRLTA